MDQKILSSDQQNLSLNDEQKDKIQSAMVEYVIDEVKKKVDIDEDLIRKKAARVVHYVIKKAEEKVKIIEKEKIEKTEISLVEQVIKEVEEENSIPSSTTN